MSYDEEKEKEEDGFDGDFRGFGDEDGGPTDADLDDGLLDEETFGGYAGDEEQY